MLVLSDARKLLPGYWIDAQDCARVPLLCHNVLRYLDSRNGEDEEVEIEKMGGLKTDSQRFDA